MSEKVLTGIIKSIKDDEQKFCTKYTLSDVPAGDIAYTLMWIVYIDENGNEVLSYSMLDGTTAK